MWQDLINQGANIEAQREDQCTSLMYASCYGHVHVVEVRFPFETYIIDVLNTWVLFLLSYQKL